MGEMTVRQAIEEQLVRYNECGREYLKQKREELKLKEEIDKTKVQMMNEMDWEALKIKLKYKKEEYIKEKMEETMKLLKEIREKKEDAELVRGLFEGLKDVNSFVSLNMQKKCICIRRLGRKNWNNKNCTTEITDMEELKCIKNYLGCSKITVKAVNCSEYLLECYV